MEHFKLFLTMVAAIAVGLVIAVPVLAVILVTLFFTLVA